MNDLIIELIDEAGTIKELDPSFENTLRLADIKGKFETILKKTDEATLDALRGPCNETLLQKLCDENLDKFVETLFQAGTSEANTYRSNSVGYDKDFDFPLLKAAINGDVKIMELLIKNGADISKAISKQNETVLHCILEKSNDDSEMIEKYQNCLSLLLGMTKLDEKTEKKRKNEVSLIVNKRDRYGNTALYYASSNSNSNFP